MLLNVKNQGGKKAGQLPPALQSEPKFTYKLKSKFLYTLYLSCRYNEHHCGCTNIVVKERNISKIYYLLMAALSR